MHIFSGINLHSVMSIAKHEKTEKINFDERQLMPCWQFRAESDGEIDLFKVWGIAAPAMDSGNSQRMICSRVGRDLFRKNCLGRPISG